MLAISDASRPHREQAHCSMAPENYEEAERKEEERREGEGSKAVGAKKGNRDG